MNWFATERQKWIDECIRVYGFINRSHLITKFGISVPQASLDLRTYLEQNPGKIRYDANARTYVRGET